jgi:hypothetical protein
MSNGVSSGDIDRPDIYILTLSRQQWRAIPIVAEPAGAPHYLVNLRSRKKGHIWALGRRPGGGWIRWAAPLSDLAGLPQIFVV